MSITMQELNSRGFIFKEYDKNLIDFNNKEQMVNNFKDLIHSFSLVDGESLFYDFDLLSKGEEIKPHYHLIPGSFQIVIWLPQNNEFTGRNFLFGTPSNLQQIKPRLGYLCIMKPNDPNFIHGVSQLTSDHNVETLGFSSLIKEIKGNQDIYIQHNSKKINKANFSQLIS